MTGTSVPPSPRFQSICCDGDAKITEIAAAAAAAVVRHRAQRGHLAVGVGGHDELEGGPV